MTDDAKGWYILETSDGQCKIAELDTAPTGDGEVWGPYESQTEAIKRRVGLIRAGKCKPA